MATARSSLCFCCLALLVLVLPAPALRGQSASKESDLEGVPVTRWFSPGNEQPMTYKEFMARQGPIQPFQIRSAPVPNRSAIETGRVLLVIVQSSLHLFIQDELATYLDDIAREGFTAEVLITMGGTPTDLRNLLIANYHEAYGSAFAGVFLVGDLPVPWYEIDDTDQFPSDLYYMDLDGDFFDDDGDGLFDRHEDGEGDRAPEIFLGRLTVSPVSGNDIALIEHYFNKVHAYRSGSFDIPERVLGFCDDDWAHWGYYGLDYSFGDVTIIDDIYETSAHLYEARLDYGYQWIHTMAHSYPQGHHFSNSTGDGWVFYYEVKAIDPWSLFYNLFACSNCRYVESNYMGGVYILCDTHGLAAVGSTKSGSMLSFEYFYEPMHRNACIGDAYRTWWEAIYPYDSTAVFWFYGMTLLGDPTLVTRPGFYNDDPAGAPGFAQYPPLLAASPEAGAEYGRAMAFGDLNDDGHPDLVVGIPGAASGGHPAAGKVEIAYGPDFNIRQEISAVQPGAGEAFGFHIEVADLNDDGKDDLAVGIPGRDRQDAVDTGAVRIFYGPSLAHGPELIPSAFSAMTRFGSCLLAADLTKDGITDLAVGAPGYGTLGMVEILEGPLFSTHVLKELNYGPMAEFGAVLAAGDVNGDKWPDLVVGAPRGHSDDRGGFTAFLGPSFKQGLAPIFPSISPVDRMASALVVADFNQDGFDDVAAGVPGGDPGGLQGAGKVRLFTGPQFNGWMTLQAPKPERFAEFGAALAVEDFNADGYPDLCVGAPFADDGGIRDAGMAYLFFGPDFTESRVFQDSLPEVNGGFGAVLEAGTLLSGMPTLAVAAPRAAEDPLGDPSFRAGDVHLSGFALTADPHVLDGQSGGTATFELRAGAAHGGQHYLMALSVSGTTPGIPLGSVNVPLNFDSITSLGFKNINTPIFSGFGGTLDAEGRGQCAFNLPPAVPGAQGVRLYFAFFTMNPIDFASNPVAVDIE